MLSTLKLVLHDKLTGRSLNLPRSQTWCLSLASLATNLEWLKVEGTQCLVSSLALLATEMPGRAEMEAPEDCEEEAGL